MKNIIALLVALEHRIGATLGVLFRVTMRAASAVRAVLSHIGAAVAELPRRLRDGLAGVVVVAALATGAWTLRDGAVNWYEAEFGRRPLLKAQSWYYRLDRTIPDEIARVPADLVVMDHASNGGRDALPAAEVDKVRRGPDGKGNRIVISYISIGEAEEYRYYWKPEWTNQTDKAKMPGWHKAANCAWPGAHAIRFWHPEWKKLIYGGPDSFIGRIVKAGFDGVYLDRVDIYEMFKDELANPEAEMITFVTELAASARAMKPGFMVIAQNAEDLLRFRRYRRVINGLGKEDLLHGADGTGVRNKKDDIAWSYTRMQLLLKDRKPVFAVEYLVTREAIAESRLELSKLGLVPTNEHRSLDGRDPTMPHFELKATEGTPEHTKANCDKSNSW